MQLLRPQVRHTHLSHCTESTPHIFQHDFEAKRYRTATGAFLPSFVLHSAFFVCLLPILLGGRRASPWRHLGPGSLRGRIHPAVMIHLGHSPETGRDRRPHRWPVRDWGGKQWPSRWRSEMMASQTELYLLPLR